jgi:hypothetical protein
MKIKNRKFLLLFVLFLVFGATLVSAAGKMCDPCAAPGDCEAGLECRNGKCQSVCTAGICIENPINACSFEDLVNNIIDFIFYIALALTPLMIIFGAFFLLTAGEDPKRVETGKNIILYTLIGFTIILLAKGLVALIRGIMG